MDNAARILKESGLHITVPRLIVLNVFLRNAHVLDHTELMSLCDKHVNRITLYRTLHVFYQHRLLIKVPTPNGITRYIYHAGRQDQHTGVYLVCQDCGKIIDLKEVSIPEITLPKNFAPKFMDLIVNGKCRPCARRYH
jgi:Fe2+ or Zn2+ uptake regulation protein